MRKSLLILTAVCLNGLGGNTTFAAECPGDFMAYNGTTAPITCGCPAEAASADGSGFDKVYGIDIYADRSLVCRAARHAGAIGEAGGNVTVIPMPGQQAYPGNRRNGIVSNDDSANRGSFRFRSIRFDRRTRSDKRPVDADCFAAGNRRNASTADSTTGSRVPDRGSSLSMSGGLHGL